MNNTLLPILVLLLGILSCSKEPDHSYTLQEYRESGVPDWDDAWTMGEYGDVLGTLRNIQFSDPLSLPRKGSRRSGELFDHLVSMDNLTFLAVDTLALHEKAYRIQPYLHIYEEFSDIYTNPRKTDQYYHRELVYIHVFGLSIVNAMMDLAHQINESEDPLDIAMQQGYPAIEYSYLAMVTGVLNKQSQASLYNEEDLELLSDSIARSVERNSFWFSPETVDNLKEKMHVVIDSSSSEHITNTYNRLLGML